MTALCGRVVNVGGLAIQSARLGATQPIWLTVPRMNRNVRTSLFQLHTEQDLSGLIVNVHAGFSASSDTTDNILACSAEA